MTPRSVPYIPGSISPYPKQIPSYSTTPKPIYLVDDIMKRETNAALFKNNICRYHEYDNLYNPNIYTY